jgi:hypothetical protein
MYGNFAGRDASRGMAKQSFDSGRPLSHTAPSIADPICDRIEMLTPIDQPLDKLGDLTPEEMLVLLLSLVANADLPFSLKREHEGLDRALHKQIRRLRAAS